MIANVGHAAFQVTDLESSVSFAKRAYGMRETGRAGGTVYLSHGPAQHSLEYRSGPVTVLDHFALQVVDAAALDELIERVGRAGLETEDSPEEPHVERSVRLRAASGHTIDLFLPTADVMLDYNVQGEPPYVPTGVRPRRVGHINLNFANLPAARTFFVDTLGFRMSDIVLDAEGEDLLYFLRCTQLHHAVGAASGPDGFFHYAFEVPSAQDLCRLGDTLDACGRQLIWGPGRHGAGDNIATYHTEPSGICIEYYAEMQLIDDPRWQPRVWSATDPRVNNLWGASQDVAPLFATSIPLAEAASPSIA